MLIDFVDGLLFKMVKQIMCDVIGGIYLGFVCYDYIFFFVVLLFVLVNVLVIVLGSLYLIQF